MEISSIIKDSFKYPFSDLKQLGLIVLMFLVVGILFGGAFYFASYMTFLNFSFGSIMAVMAIALILGFIVSIVVCGYQISIVEVACDLEDNIPSFNFSKNFNDGLKTILIYLVFYVIGGLIAFICMFLSIGLTATGESTALALAGVIYLVLLVCLVLLCWTFSMSLCRLAYYDSLSEALDLAEAYRDLRKIGLANMLVYVIVIGILLAIISFATLVIVVSFIATVDYPVVEFICTLIVFAVISYIFVVQSRAIGLLYSDII